MKKEIISYWDYEKADWDEDKSCFINRRWSDVKEKLLKIEFDKNDDTDDPYGTVLRFIGGPTGFESYYLKDLLTHNLNNDDQFCICGGTINSWARCFVKCSDLNNIIKAYRENN